MLSYPHAPPSAGRTGTQAHQLPFRQADQVLPTAWKRRRSAAHRQGIPGVQRRPALRGLPHLHRQDAGPGERHDHRLDGGGRADARWARRLRDRDDGPRPGRLHDQHRREPLSRPALRAELHAPPRLAVPRRRGAVRAGDHPHLRRAVPGDRAARDRLLHPRLPGALGALGPDRDLGVPLPARPGSAAAQPRVRGILGGRAGRRSPASRSTRRLPATARSA